MAPVGHPEPLRTVIGIALSEYDVVWVAGGHPHRAFPTNYDDLLRFTGGHAQQLRLPPASSVARATLQ